MIEFLKGFSTALGEGGGGGGGEQQKYAHTMEVPRSSISQGLTFDH